MRWKLVNYSLVKLLRFRKCWWLGLMCGVIAVALLVKQAAELLHKGIITWSMPAVFCSNLEVTASQLLWVLCFKWSVRQFSSKKRVSFLLYWSCAYTKQAHLMLVNIEELRSLFCAEFLSEWGNSSLLRLLCCIRHLLWCQRHLLSRFNDILQNTPVGILMPRALLSGPHGLCGPSPAEVILSGWQTTPAQACWRRLCGFEVPLQDLR